jgi:hypothetical protein
MRYTALREEFRPGMHSRQEFGLFSNETARVLAQGWTRNLSEGGVNAFVAHNLALGEFVVLEIPFPDAASQDIPAQVVRALGTEYGTPGCTLSATVTMHTPVCGTRSRYLRSN